MGRFCIRKNFVLFFYISTTDLKYLKLIGMFIAAIRNRNGNASMALGQHKSYLMRQNQSRKVVEAIHFRNHWFTVNFVCGTACWYFLGFHSIDDEMELLTIIAFLSDFTSPQFNHGIVTSSQGYLTNERWTKYINETNDEFT